jgi:hypothetical protein
MVEMMIVMAIFMAVFLLIAVVLTTVLKVADVSTGRITARQESEFMLNVLQHTLRNSDPEFVHVYDMPTDREFDPVSSKVFGQVSEYVQNEVGSEQAGNEIHIKPFYSNRWMCFGVFTLRDDTERQVLLKTSTDLELDSVGHEHCFDSDREDFAEYTIVLNSDSVDVNSVNVMFIDDMDNIHFMLEMKLMPTYWASGKSSFVRPEYDKVVVVSTRKVKTGY